MTKSILCLIALFTTLPTIQVRNKDSSQKIVFVGTVRRIASDTGIRSGDLAIYRLVSYKVEHVCQGEYNEKAIVVDHLILTGKELDGIKVGDRVCVSVEKSKNVLARFNAEGIRSSNETVKIFFVGGKVAGSSEGLSCSCCPTRER